jgi:hypothetical protein
MPIDRRIAAFEAAPRRTSLDRLALPELHAKAIGAIADALPDHAATHAAMVEIGA